MPDDEALRRLAQTGFGSMGLVRRVQSDDRLVNQAYDELRAIAHRRLMQSAAAGATLNTTELVHEAWLKLGSAQTNPWRDRAHFLATAAVAMRHILVDRARGRATIKRGQSARMVTLDADAVRADGQPETLLEIDDAIERLDAVSPRLARLVVLRFYGGLTDPEIADVLAVTPRTVQRDWLKARALLQRLLAP